MNEIEFIKSMDVLGIRENDILAIKVDHELSYETIQNITKSVSDRLPNGLKGKVSVFVLEPGIDFGVIRKEAA
ncbi:MAG TPA: hypothetical protein VMW42_07985 [Desulfatiglandales bacterium]|nr:hypothetical protein [Desulfatiglandales bacterium]